MMKLDNLLDDRIQLANTISVLEDETEDSQYRTSLTEDVLPEANEDLSSGMFNGLRMVDFSIYRLCYFCMLTNLPAIANKVSKVAEGEGGGSFICVLKFHTWEKLIAWILFLIKYMSLNQIFVLQSSHPVKWRFVIGREDLSAFYYLSSVIYRWPIIQENNIFCY